MKIVVKIGGAALEDKSRLRKCARAIVELARDGHHVAVVHGGGSALTRTLKLLGKESDFVNGLRITDAETRDVALMVLSGIVNKSLVAAIVAAGSAAVGLCGADGMAFRARKKQNAGCDLGFVGEICYAEPRWIEAIWSAGGIPVLSSVALGFRRRVLQHQCRPNGVRLRCGLPCRLSDFPHRCGWSEGRRWCRNPMVEHERCSCIDRPLRHRRGNVA